MGVRTMARSQTLVFLVGTICLLSLFGLNSAKPGTADDFIVEGQVYCDTCRVQFITKVSEFMEGAIVRLQCHNLTGGRETYNAEADTDKNGRYKFEVDGDYEDDDCEVVLSKSPKDDCSEIPTDKLTRMAAKVSLTSNNGVVDRHRNANPLGFLKKDPLPQCPDILKELGIPNPNNPNGGDNANDDDDNN